MRPPPDRRVRPFPLHPLPSRIGSRPARPGAPPATCKGLLASGLFASLILSSCQARVQTHNGSASGEGRGAGNSVSSLLRQDADAVQGKEDEIGFADHPIAVERPPVSAVVT